ncbi:MAG: hypothetical protein ACRCUS_01325, partial [Anaerovoracaceae bacterium]
MAKGVGRIWTQEEKDYLREIVPGKSHKEITELMNLEFTYEYEISQIKGAIGRYKLNTGRTGYFPKGQEPHNKGKKMPTEIYERCKATMFKKGQVPPNKRELGSERINVEGYIEVKIAEHYDPNAYND